MARDDAESPNEAVQPEERHPEPVSESVHENHQDPKRLLALFELMLLIRAFEPEAERQYKAAKIGGYCHLATGQEAAHVGAVGAMREDDVLIAAYRDHGLALARYRPQRGDGRAVRPGRRVRARARRLDAPA